MVLTVDLPTVESLERPTDDATLRALQPGLGPQRAVLGGGTWLFSTPQPHLRGLVDLTALGWPPLVADRSGLTIAATATLAELADGVRDPGRPDVPDRAPADAAPSGSNGSNGQHGADRGPWPALALVAPCCEALVGSRKVQQVATVGGNVALALPAAPVITLAAALDGTAHIWTGGGGERREPVVDLVAGAQRTTLGAGDVLRAIHVPAHALRARTAVRKVSLSPLGRSAVLVAGRVDPSGECVIALTASLERPVVLRFDRVPDGAGLRAAVDVGRDWYDDPHGSPAWRRAMTVHAAEGVRAELAAPVAEGAA